jgi:tripartite-type tricarboxylate transporter receptor subunit TctC
MTVFTRLRFIALTVAMATLFVGCSEDVANETYPSRAITIIVPFAPGGGGDVYTRAIARQAQEILGTKVFVENRSGGSGTIGVGSVARATSDGYTLGFVSNSPVIMAPNFLNVPYDPETQLTYLARFVITPNPVMVKADSPFQTFADMLEYGRANPGRLRWSTSGINGASHIATQAVFDAEGVQAALLPMTGSSEVLAGLLGGTTDVGVISDYAGPVAAGDVRLLAEMGSEPIAEFPEIPTFKGMGYPLSPTIFFGLAGPAQLPADVIAKWGETMTIITASEEFKQIAAQMNGRVAYLNHAEFHAAVLADITTMRETLIRLGIKK